MRVTVPGFAPKDGKTMKWANEPNNEFATTVSDKENETKCKNWISKSGLVQHGFKGVWDGKAFLTMVF